MPRRKGSKHPPSALGQGGTISRGTAYGLKKRRALEAELEAMRAALYRVSPAELDALRISGTLSPSTAFCSDVAAAEILRLRRAVEGEPAPGTNHPPRPLSTQRVARLAQAQRILTLALACESRALTANDREAAATAGALLGKADALLVATLGLDPPELDVVGDYRRAIAEHALRTRAANAAQPSSQAAPSADRASASES